MAYKIKLIFHVGFPVKTGLSISFCCISRCGFMKDFSCSDAVQNATAASVYWGRRATSLRRLTRIADMLALIAKTARHVGRPDDVGCLAGGDLRISTAGFEDLGAATSARATEFWMCWRRFSWVLERPWYSELQ